MSKIGELSVFLTAKTSQLDKALLDTQKKMRKFESGFARMGKSLTKNVTLPLLLMGAGAVKAFADFDKAMTESLAIMGDVSDAMKKDMADAAMDMSTKSTFAAKELGAAYFYLASAGLDAAQSIKALPVVAKFAQAGTFDLSRATDLLTDAQTALGLSAKDAVKNQENMIRVSDVLVKANTLANASVEQFSEALTNRAAAALRMLGKEMEEGVAVLAAYADQGRKGSEAGEALNIVMRDLQRAAIKNKGAFKEAGVAVYDAHGEMRNMADIIEDLEGHLAGMSDEQKKATLTMLGFQERSQANLITLLGMSEKIRGYETALKSAAGTTEEVYKKQLTAFTNQLKILRNELVNVAAEFGEHLVPVLKKVIDKYIKPAVGWFRDLTDEQKELMVKTGLLAAAIGPLIVALGKLKIALAALNGPFVILAGLFVASIALSAKLRSEDQKYQDSLYGSKKHVDDFNATLKAQNLTLGISAEQLEKLKKKYNGNMQAITEAILSGKEFIEVQEDVGDSAEDTGKKLDKTSAAFERVGTAIDKVTIPPLLDLKLELARLDGKLKNNEITLDEWADQAVVVKDRIKKLEGGVGELGMALEELEIDFDSAGASSEDIANAVFRAAGQFPAFETAVENWGKKVNTTTKEAKTAWTDFADGLRTEWANSISDVLQGATSLKDGLKGIWGAVKNQFFDMIGEMVARWLTDFIASIVTSTGNVVASVTSSLTAVGSAITGVATGLASLITTLATAIATAATTLAAAAPAIMVVAAMALAIYAGFKILGSIFGKKGKPNQGVERILNLIWEEARNILNNVDNIKWQLEDIKTTGWRIADNIIPILDDIKHIGWTMSDILRSIEAGIGDVVNAIKGIPGAASGFHGTVSQPTMMMVHPNESIDITPFKDMGRQAPAQTVVKNYHTYEIHALDSQSFEEALKRGGGSVIEKRVQKALDLKNIRVPMSGVGR